MPSRFAPPVTRARGLSEFRFQARYQRFQASRHAVARPRLTGVLVGAAPELLLLAAPPGFGKSTLLAQWSELDDRPFAYLSLAHGASDSGVFWGSVVEAIREVVPDVGEATLAMLHAPGPAAHDAALPVLLGELEAAETDLVLVLDDYQAVTSHACHESLSSFLEVAPRSVTVAISTRADPPIPLARLRVLGELLELRATDLGFTSEEEAAFLNEALGLDLPPDSLVRLHERTEGWPAGVQLAALSLAGVTDRASFVEHFGGSSRHVVDYLTEVVLDALEPDLRRFLLETSILDTLTAPLCDAVTSRDDSDELLHTAERSNLFLSPLDDRREWYRYHQLFAEVLQSELLRGHAELVPELHRRAFEWLAAGGYTYDAMRHAVAIGEIDAAGALLRERWRPAFARVRAEATLRCLGALPAETVRRDARLGTMETWALSMLNRRDEARLALESMRATGSELSDERTVETGTALVHACFPWGDVGSMLPAALRLNELRDEYPPEWRPVTLIALGWAHWFSGRPDLARAPVEEALADAPRFAHWLAVAVAKGLLARIYLASGDLAAAENLAREAEEILEVERLHARPSAGIVDVALGAVAGARDDLDEAVQLLERGRAKLRVRGEELYVADALLVSAPVLRAHGNAEEARAALGEARELIGSCPDPGALRDRLEEVAHALTPAHRRVSADSDLTERELDVLRYLAEGLSKREIGNALFLSFNTIHSHTRSIYQKLRVSSRKDALERARDLGVL
ncbi:MAG TPA: LuxR C-terminal-related transcriptional regulator [Gaiellaceae bacterium]|nr:LuxR C-terminal-related transcriptional regulator [Gaiellaceae bacterium]